MAEESGNAGVAMLGGQSMKRTMTFKTRGYRGNTCRQRMVKCKNYEIYVKRQGIWDKKAHFWLLSSLKTKASPPQGIILWDSATTGFQES